MPSWLDRLLGRKDAAPPAKKESVKFWLSDQNPPRLAPASYSGKLVTDASAMSLSAVWACVRLNSEAVAGLPLKLYQKDPNGGRRLAEHPLAQILDSPNADLTGFEFWQGMAAWLLVRGNAYAEISRIGDRVVSLNLLPADRIMVTRNQAGDLRYAFSDRGKRYELPAESVLHIKGFGFGGDLGLSPVQYGIQTLGAATATEEAAAKIFAQGLMSSGIIKVDGELSEEQRQQFAKFLEAYAGSNRAGKVMVLEAGADYQQLSLDPESSQMIQSRGFSVEEVCRWFGTPPVAIGHANVTAWGSGIEQLILQWLTAGLNPLLTRIEHRIQKQLLGPGDRQRFYAEYNREALLQADSTAKAAFLSSMTQNGLITRNEGRAKLNLPAMPGGDVLTAQTNLAPLDRLGGGGDAAVKSAFRSWLGIEDSNAQDS